MADPVTRFTIDPANNVYCTRIMLPLTQLEHYHLASDIILVTQTLSFTRNSSFLTLSNDAVLNSGFMTVFWDVTPRSLIEID
jgi:hypothetical protein